MLNTDNTSNLVTGNRATVIIYNIGIINSDRVNNVTTVTLHVCNEIISLILLPKLTPLATTIVIVIIIVIVHLMIIALPALPFCARLNPATPSPQS